MKESDAPSVGDADVPPIKADAAEIEKEWGEALSKEVEGSEQLI